MGSAILRIHLQSLFLLVHLIRMLTSWLVLRGSQFCTAEGNTVVCRGKGRLKLCGWHTGGCLCRQPTVQLWLCTERAEHMHSNNGTAKMACHRPAALFPVRVSSLQILCRCRLCWAPASLSVSPWAVLSCPRNQDGYLWDRRGTQHWELKALMAHCLKLHLSFDKHSVSVSFDLLSRLWTANLPMSVLQHSRLCPKI